MKYKVGDKVKVHTKEWFDNNCCVNGILDIYSFNRNSNSFVSDMINFCGQEVTICKIGVNGYKISEDERWYWEDWMFEDMNNNTNTISNPNIVEDFAKLIGVELDEEFYDTNGGFCYKFTADSGLMVYDDTVEDWRVAFAYSLTAFFKMIKDGRFTKKWTPKDGDTLYVPAFCYKDLWSYITYDSKNEHDKEMVKSGLYFKTQKEAIECAKKIIKNMKEG